ncbi:MAG: hypothetical protein KAK01_08125, partial [Candidatus Marinimicrobia bacterium]|nr:hypothetical protein [Candidatus Neomarinimicrobiota bacterium]
LKSEVESAIPKYLGPVWYVDADASGPDYEGSPEDPFNEIGDAWGAGTPNQYFDSGDTVLVLPGTYDSFYDLNLMAPDLQFVILGEKGADSTFIDGGENKRFISFENFNYDVSTKIIGLTIQNCAAADNGGAVRLVNGANIRVIDCIIDSNSTTGPGAAGGAIFVSASSPRFIRTDFRGNHASGQGGAIYIDGYDSRPRFFECVFDGNETDNDQNGEGGAIASANIPLFFQRCQFTNNQSYGSGGAIFQQSMEGYQGWTVITNSLFAGNSARGAGSFTTGSAINVNSVDLLLENVTVVDNSCDITSSSDDWQGGAIFYSDASVHLQNSIVWDNTPVPTYQGQINNTWSPSNLSINNSLIENGTQYGGIVYDFDPLFVDPANDDYHLSEASHAIGRGITPYQSPTDGSLMPVDLLDLEGNDRVQPDDRVQTTDPSSLDLGAYERPEATTAYPSWPQNLAVEPRHKSVILGWDDPLETTDVDYYIVYQGLAEDGTLDSVSMVQSDMARSAVYDTIIDLVNGTEYFFAVSAVDTSGYE